MNYKSLISIVLITLFIISCKKEKVGGECDYATVIKEVKVTFIDGSISNDDFMISFQPLGTDGNEVYRVNKNDFIKINRNFDLKQLLDSNQVYNMKIDEISKGSCTPFIITDIKLY